MYNNSITMKWAFFLLLIFLFLFPFCKKEKIGLTDDEVVVEEPKGREEVVEVPTAIKEKEAELREDLEVLIVALENKEEELRAKESELNTREANLHAKETEVMKKEEKLKSRETASYVVLAIGIILIVIVVIVGIRRLPGKAFEEKDTAKKKEDIEKSSSEAQKDL